MTILKKNFDLTVEYPLAANSSKMVLILRKQNFENMDFF